MKIHDAPFEYEGLFKNPARCDLRIYEMGRGQPDASTIIVVFSEPEDGYKGLSVTNGAEKIATAVYYDVLTKAPHLSRLIWIERYPARHFGRDHEESFDLVTFAWESERGRDGYSRLKARSPVWHRVSRAWVEELIREKY